MLLQRLYEPTLAQASYLIGCTEAAEALVVDPHRDVDQYLAAAAEHGVRIAHITETHIHADFVSGSRELAARTGAAMYLSGDGGPDWEYRYAADTGARLLHEGDRFAIGNVRVDVMHTPGHTPEHLTFLITDGAAATEPIAAVTGDFVFVGDVGRPDLLERAAQVSGTMEESARTLFRTLQRFKSQPDYLQIWPGHGAGSACGKGLSAIPHSTVGYERRFNWAFGVTDEEEFVRLVLAGQPEPPRYFGTMKRINRDGPRVLHGLSRPERLGPHRLAEVLGAGAFVIDTRSAAEYAEGHVPGTLNIPLNSSFTTWAGWLAPYDRDLYLLVGERGGAEVDEAVRDLAMIGLDRVAGCFGPEALREWKTNGQPLAMVRRISVQEAAERMNRRGVAVVDVRGRSEWEAGHIPGVVNVPLGYLSDRLGELPRGLPLVVQCQSGARSAIAASLLQAHGLTDVLNLGGGFAEWEAAGLPLERAAPGALAETVMVPVAKGR